MIFLQGVGNSFKINGLIESFSELSVALNLLPTRVRNESHCSMVRVRFIKKLLQRYRFGR